MERQATEDGNFTVLWYEPQMPRGQIDNIGEFHKSYSHCIDRQWVPSQELNDKVPIDTIITAWKNTIGISNLVSVFGIWTEKQINIPTTQKYHVRQHLEYIDWPLDYNSRKIVFYNNFGSFWTHHFKHLRQFRHVIPNIHVTLDHFPVTLDISCHFRQCHKRPCFLLVGG